MKLLDRRYSNVFLLLASIVLAVSIVVSSSVSAQFSEPGRQAKLSVDKIALDAGKLYSGEVYNARWIVKNTGNDTLKISDVYTSCGCTSAKIPKRQLLPGEFDTLDVRFNSSNFRGKVSKYIEVISNDPDHRATTLTLTAEVMVELEPLNGSQVVWLGSASLGKEIKYNVLFKNNSGRTITINGYSATGKDVRGPSGTITVKPSDTLSLPLVVMPSKAGYVEEKLLFNTDSKKQSVLTVSVTYSGVASK